MKQINITDYRDYIPGKSNNGGHYTYTYAITKRPEGDYIVEQFSSCDFIPQPQWSEVLTKKEVALWLLTANMSEDMDVEFVF